MPPLYLCLFHNFLWQRSFNSIPNLILKERFIDIVSLLNMGETWACLYVEGEEQVVKKCRWGTCGVVKGKWVRIIHDRSEELVRVPTSSKRDCALCFSRRFSCIMWGSFPSRSGSSPSQLVSPLGLSSSPSSLEFALIPCVPSWAFHFSWHPT